MAIYCHNTKKRIVLLAYIPSIGLEYGFYLLIKLIISQLKLGIFEDRLSVIIPYLL